MNTTERDAEYEALRARWNVIQDKARVLAHNAHVVEGETTNPFPLIAHFEETMDLLGDWTRLAAKYEDVEKIKAIAEKTAEVARAIYAHAHWAEEFVARRAIADLEKN